MSRDYAHTNTTIWQDGDWRALPYPAQHLYNMLWTHPSLNYCGVADWRPARLVPLAGGLSLDLIENLADCLEARHFIVRDEESEEVLLRSWVRWDGLMRKPRMAISWVKAYAETASNTIRGVVVHEGRKLRDREPELTCWADDRVITVLQNEAIDAKRLDPVYDPFAPEFDIDLRVICHPFAANPTSGLRSFSTPPTPSPAPSPYSIAPSPNGARFVGRPTSEPPGENAPADKEGDAADYLVADFADWCETTNKPIPTLDTKNTLSRIARRLLDEGVTPDEVMSGMKLWRTKGNAGAAALASFVEEARTQPRPNGRQAKTDDMFAGALQRAQVADQRKAIR